MLVAMAGGSYGLYAWLQTKPLPKQLLYANGHVEGTEVHVAAEVAGRVIASRVMEGRTVQRGDLLVQLDDSELNLQKARAEAEAASLRSQRKASSAELALWQHHRETAQTDLDRARQLKDKGAATAQQLDQAENVAKAAAGRVAALKAQLASFQDRIQAALRDVDLMTLRISKTHVVAPTDGTILAKTAEVGEFLQPGRTVAVLVDLSQITLKVFLPEAEVGKLKLGAAARVRVDAFASRLFDARVERVDQQAQFTPRDIHMPQERTRMVFGITLAVDNRDRLLKPGMPADAWILWQSQAGWPSELFVPG